MYSQARLIRTLLIRHFRLIHLGNLKTLKALSLTPMINYPLNLSPRLVHRKISVYFSDELSGSNCISSPHTTSSHVGRVKPSAPNIPH